jgi:hypothetical protein
MCEASKTLTFGAMSIGKDLGDEDPDHRALTNRVRGDKGKNANGNDRVMRLKKSPGN